MASFKTNKNKNWTPLVRTNFSKLETLSLGPKRFLYSKGHKSAICLWLTLRSNLHCFTFSVSAKDKLPFQDIQSEGIFLGPKANFLATKRWSSEVLSDFCFMPLTSILPNLVLVYQIQIWHTKSRFGIPNPNLVGQKLRASNTQS